MFGSMDLQLWLWRDNSVLQDAVRLLIAASNIEILAEAIRALLVHQSLSGVVYRKMLRTAPVEGSSSTR